MRISEAMRETPLQFASQGLLYRANCLCMSCNPVDQLGFLANTDSIIIALDAGGVERC